jgi:putative ABC transport system permease protein
MIDLLLRLRALFRRTAVDREIDEELQFHVDRQIESYKKAGLDTADAARRARLDFGGVDQMKEEYGDALGVRFLDDLWRDIRLALRGLRATPVVAAVAISSLALGIGANTAIFSIVNSLLLRSLPVKEPRRLVLLSDSVLTRLVAWSHPAWEQIHRQPGLFESSAAWSFYRFNLASGGETQFVDGLWASGSFFDTLGVSALLGRTFTDADDRRGGGPDGPVAVVSYGFWQNRLGSAADVVGRSLRLDGVAFTIVGVTPADFFGADVGRTFDVIVPLGTDTLIRGRDAILDDVGTRYLTIIARLRPGQTLDAAVAGLRQAQPRIREATLPDVSLIGRQAVEQYLTSPFTVRPAATGDSTLRLRYGGALMMVMVIVVLVLLVACVNIANLLLARAAARRHELSVRVALGASRWRVARQLFAESLVLSGAGTTLGLLVATWSSRALVRQISMPPASAVFLDLSIDGRVLAFTAAVATLTTLLFGTAPAFRASGVAPLDALKDRARTTAASRHGRMAGWLVVAQIALSVVLVAAAALFVRSFASLATRSLGFEPRPVLVVSMYAKRGVSVPEERLPLFERARDAVRGLPNVAEAAVSYVTPVSRGAFTPRLEVSGVPFAETQNEVFGNLISPGWFNALGTPLVAGRDLTERDRAGAPRVAIVNQEFVRRFFGHDDPLGRTITLYPRTPRALPPMEIVGVVGDAVYTSVRDTAPPTWYMPAGQFDTRAWPFTAISLVVRSKTGSPMLLTNSIAAAIAGVNPQLALTFQPLAAQVNAAIAQERLIALITAFFGALALLLAGLGLYGVAAYTVSRRRNEIGIRMALGARPAGVIRLVLARMSVLVCVGATLGVAVSLWASRFVAALIYGASPRDPITLVGAVTMLAAVGALASWLPAWRAATVDPASVLREG